MTFFFKITGESSAADARQPQPGALKSRGPHPSRVLGLLAVGGQIKKKSFFNFNPWRGGVAPQSCARH